MHTLTYAGNSVEAPSRDGLITIAFSAAAAGFGVILFVFFIVTILCLCRCYHQKRRSRLIMIKTLRPSVTYKKPDHFYDEIDVQPKQELGTKKNEAYYSTVK